jgi:EmrB/QacA subfamily drug resistance transporter
MTDMGMTMPGAEPLPPHDRWLVLITIGVGTFMSALDGSIVNVLLPVIARELNTTVAGIEWVSTVYLLVVSGLLLGVGRAGDLYGNKRMYIAGFAVFVIGSALCGFAPTAPALVALRSIQAVGASMLYANAPAILTKSFPREQRGRALGALATFTYLGLTVGPSLGGWLAGAFGWRSVFYINIPIGLVAVVLALRYIAHDRPQGQRKPFDYAGAALFMTGLIALLTALNEGHALGWSSPRIIGLFVASIVLLTVVFRVELKSKSPMLDLSLFRNRVFSATTTTALLNYSCVSSALFTLPFLLIQARHLTPRDAGLVLTMQPIIMAIVAPFSGSLSDRIGSRTPAALGMATLTTGLLLLAFFVESGSLMAIAASLGVVGLGIGLFTSPNNSALMGAAPRTHQGIASGVLATARNVGMVMGIGISAAVLTTIMAHTAGSAGLVLGVQMSLLVAAGLAAAGIGTALVRG